MPSFYLIPWFLTKHLHVISLKQAFVIVEGALPLNNCVTVNK